MQLTVPGSSRSLSSKRSSQQVSSAQAEQSQRSGTQLTPADNAGQSSPMTQSQIATTPSQAGDQQQQQLQQQQLQAKYHSQLCVQVGHSTPVISPAG